MYLDEWAILDERVGGASLQDLLDPFVEGFLGDASQRGRHGPTLAGRGEGEAATAVSGITVTHRSYSVRQVYMQTNIHKKL